MGAVGIAVQIEEIDLEQGYIDGITQRYNRIYRDIYDIGAILADARRKLSYHKFMSMIERKLPFGRTTAYMYIREWAAQLESGDAVRPVEQLSDSYSIRNELERLTPEELDAGIAAGRIRQGVPRAEVISFRKELRTAHQHRPDALNTPAPSRPDGPGAATYGELVHLLIEWRKVRALPQSAVDHLIGCAEGQTGKYEIPHTDDGRTLTWKALFELCAVYRIGVQFVPLDAA